MVLRFVRYVREGRSEGTIIARLGSKFTRVRSKNHQRDVGQGVLGTKVGLQTILTTKGSVNGSKCYAL
jgi:hypothetical protein